MNPVPASVNRMILPIQYLRGIAALMVVWYHAAGEVPGVSDFLAPGFGSSGVDLFFVISGFIMVATTSRNAPTAAEFMRRRLVRVVPLYWLLTLAMVAAALCLPSLFRSLIVTPATLVESLLFIPHFSNSFPTMAWPLLVPGWTLNFEMFFYAVFALSLLLPARARLPALALTFCTLVGIGLACGPFSIAAAQVYFSPRLIEFVAGAAIATWWQRGGRLPGAAPSALLLAIGFALLARSGLPPLYEFTEMIGATLMVIAALSPRFAQWRLAPLHALGDSSYSLYLTHLFTLGLLRVVWAHALPPVDDLFAAAAFMAVALAASSAVGWLAYRFLEVPTLDWLNARTRPRRIAPATAP